MTTFAKGQIVSFRNESGDIVSGKINAVGATLLGVDLKGGGYEALSMSKALPQTPAQKAGLQIGDVVTVGHGIACPHGFRIGESAIFKRDDRSNSPLFEQRGETQYLDLSEITIGEDSRTPAQKMGLAEGDEVLMEDARGRGFRGRIFLHRDDGTTIPRFRDERGHEHYATLDDVTKAPVRVVPAFDDRTPAAKAGLKVGDTVELLKEDLIGYFGSKFTKLKRDDGSSMPRFGEGEKSLWIGLEDVRKAPEGPKEGVKWSEAPAGATHYSLESSHRAKWHKLDEAGQWFYHEDGRFNIYYETRYAYPASQVAIPGVVVEVNPLNAVLDEVKALEARVREKLTAAEQLNREVSRLNTEKQAKLAEIKAGGFKVEGGKLVKHGKSMAEWQDGDKVKCVTRDGRGLANIIVGGVYVVRRRGTDIAVIDGDGDEMRGCVERNCFEFHEAAPRLQDIPATEWKAGDTVEAVEANLDITIGKRYTITEMCDAGADLRVKLRDDVNFPRRRPTYEFKLVARA